MMRFYCDDAWPRGEADTLKEDLIVIMTIKEWHQIKVMLSDAVEGKTLLPKTSAAFKLAKQFCNELPCMTEGTTKIEERRRNTALKKKIAQKMKKVVAKMNEGK